MFYLIGLGLVDPMDISVKALEIVKRCSRVYLETYTSILGCHKEELEVFYGRPLLLADRDLVEEKSDEILTGASEEEVALLVVGDPFGATTHIDLALRARDKKIPYKVIHNASIITAVGCCGLQLYKFGEIVAVPFWDETWKPESFYEKIKFNRLHNMHTLCLLDIKVVEPTAESPIRRRRQIMRFMTVADAAQQLLAIVDRKNALEHNTVLNDLSMCVGLARVGSETQRIVAKTLHDMASTDLGGPLHCLIIPSKELHPLEIEYLQGYATFKLDSYNY
uniref:diphthine methyl ester synthase n=1 Tax=Glossina brevipalpis TaxID=37001 RepID=A0A1A9WLZ1_9MUSC